MVGVEEVSVLVGKLELFFLNVYWYSLFSFLHRWGKHDPATLGLVCHVRT